MSSWFNTKARSYVVTDEEYANRCRWEDLSAYEKELVCDGGCGISIFGRKIVPDYVFRDVCCHHDFAFLRGGDARVRALVENAFAEELRFVVLTSNQPQRYKTLAYFYKTATRRFSWLAWPYGPMRTKEEILALAKRRET